MNACNSAIGQRLTSLEPMSSERLNAMGDEGMRDKAIFKMQMEGFSQAKMEMTLDAMMRVIDGKRTCAS